MPGEIQEEEVRKAISATKKDKAPGPDGLPNRILHIVAGEALALLTRVFQACIDQGVHPDHFKEATMVMIRKPGKPDYTDPSAYRPIALLNTLGKALEAVVSNRMRYLAETHALLPQTQMGARGQRSTETALDLLTEQIHTVWGAAKPRVATMLCLDVKGAFDNVSHARLTHDLRKRRIPTKLVEWVTDFLKGRKAEIRIADYTLESRMINAGIPQGSPISPILYLFYNADLLEACESKRYKTSVVGFVDDVNILTYGATTEGNCKNLERTHLACETWARSHGSKFATAKYELIHFTRKPKRFNMAASVKFADTEVKPVREVRILGVKADSQLRWQCQIRAVEAHAARLLGALRSLTGSTWGTSQHTGLKIYLTMIRPALLYGGNAWYTPATLKGARKGMGQKLHALQGRFLRVATGAYRATSTEAVEVETFTPPIDIYLESILAKAAIRLCGSQASSVIQVSCDTIRRGLRGQRRRLARVSKTPNQRKKLWLKEQGIDLDDLLPRPVYQAPPWQEENRPRIPGEEHAARMAKQHAIISKVKEEILKRWTQRWANGTKGAHLRALIVKPEQKTRMLY